MPTVAIIAATAAYPMKSTLHHRLPTFWAPHPSRAAHPGAAFSQAYRLGCAV